MPHTDQTPSTTLPTAFVVITDGIRIRNVLFSNVLPLLKQEFRLVILVPSPDVEAIRHEFGATNVIIEQIPDSHSRIESKFTFVRRFLLSNPARNKTVSVFSSIMKKEQPLHYAIIKYVNPWLGRSKWLRDMWLRFEAHVCDGSEYEQLFRTYNPRLIVSTDYGSQRHEIRILRYAHKAGVKTASIVYSWDNLSSKGVMGCRPQQLLVWNDIMCREAQELHDIPAGAVHACGAAQFDIYARTEEFLSRAEFCRSMRLDPTCPIIVYGTITPRFFSGNLEIIDILIKAIQKGALPRNAQLLIRLHPQTINKKGNYSHFADELTPYLELERNHPFVRVDQPKTVLWGSLVSPAREDAKHLAELLHHAAVLIHPGSTLVVDASAIGCPAIGLGFDGYEEKPYDESIRRWWDYTYMEPVVRSGGQPIATSPEQLVSLVNKFIEDRGHLAERRALIRDWECYKVDGKSAERIVSRLKTIVAE